MARFQRPSDPRQAGRRQRHQRASEREPIPWLWLALGTLVTFAAIVFALALANAFLARPPLMVTLAPTPTIIHLTAPPSPVPSATPLLPTPTPIPTLTPVPTPDVSIAPQEVTVGYYAVVVAELGVTVRGGPSTNNVALAIADQGTVLLVLDGPRQANSFTWWQVRLEDGTEGWVAGEFLEPAARP